MKIEHLALNVTDPVAMADWYVKHLGMTLKRSGPGPVHARFLADDGGAVMLEIYRNDSAFVPDYTTVAPLTLHLAIYSQDVAADRKRLVAAGATALTEVEALTMGDSMAMMRDPWGVPIQLIHRSQRLI